MIEVLVHQGGQVLPPALGHVLGVVIPGLVDIPHVGVLVQHQHAQRVAGVQQSLGAGVMGGTDGVIARLLQQPHLPHFGVWKRNRPQNTVVVVDAGTTEDDPLAVDAKAVFAVAGDGANAKGLLPHILSENYTAGVALGGVRTPQLRVRERDVHCTAGLALACCLSQLPVSVQNRDLSCAGADQGESYADGGANVVQGLNLQAVKRDVLFGQNVEPHRAVDTRAGVPAGVGLVGVAGDDPDMILTVCSKQAVQSHEKAGVASGLKGGLAVVDKDLRIPVYALKLQKHGPVRPLRRDVEGLLVDVVIALKPASVGPAGGLRRPRLGEHGVVGERDSDGLVFLAHAGYKPVGVKW